MVGRVCNIVTGSPRTRELSPKLSGLFHLNCNFEPFGLTGRASEAFLATWFFSVIFYQTRRPESATLATKKLIYALDLAILVARVCKNPKISETRPDPNFSGFLMSDLRNLKL